MTGIFHGIRCHIFQNGEGGKRIYLGMQENSEKECAEIFDKVKVLSEEKNFTLIFFEVKSWNDDFSPWEHSAVFGNEGFGGNGAGTLEWLENLAMPYFDKKFGAAQKNFIAGYSLAGLFSLWAFFECESFDGAAGCSASLWFSGWNEYIKGCVISRESVIYLSLGDKEEKTKNAVMSAVGKNTRLTFDRISAFENAVCRLEYNCGGHFNDVGGRIAKGIDFLLNN